MLERRTLGEIPAKPHTLFKDRSGNGVPECVFTRDGFSGGFSCLYQEHEPTGMKSAKLLDDKAATKKLIGEPLPLDEQAISRRHIRSGEAPTGRDLVGARTALFSNATTRISVARGAVGNSDYAFCNGDADELYFVYEGAGELHSIFGAQIIRKHDYVLIPRGVPYRFTTTDNVEMLIVEGDPAIEIPTDFRNPHGQLKLEAPFTHRDFGSPTRLLDHSEAEAFSRILSLRNKTITEHIYHSNPAHTVGWDGSVYPITFNIHDYLPKTGKIHLPPNMHLTFRSQRFVVCSFVPRMVDYLEGAVPCPYPHANVECDEILYYVSGRFTSRAGINERSISFHPAGIPHGPQPGRYLKSVGQKHTDELAVMVDTWDSLQVCKAALAWEDNTYPTSWDS